MSKPIHIQRGLFDQPTLNVIKPIKEAMNRDVLNSGLSRDQVVDRMNDLATSYGICLANGNSHKLTAEIFEKWLNPNALSRQMPLKAIPVFCAAVGNCSVLDVLARPIGSRVIGRHEQKMLSWAEAKMAIREHNRTVRKLESEL